MNGLYDNHIIRSNNIIQAEAEAEQMDISSEHTPIIDDSDSESESELESESS
jgi:hypothetical protein